MNRWRGDRGASTVEMAMLLPVLVVLVFGIIDFGRMFNAQITITEAAREGARVQALGGTYTTGSAVTNRVNAVITDPEQRKRVRTPVDQSGCTGGNLTTDNANVTVTYNFEFFTPFAPRRTLTATGVVACVP